MDNKSQPMSLDLNHLKDITDGFADKKEIGRGGFGIVYKV
jgi:hypothetical protein